MVRILLDFHGTLVLMDHAETEHFYLDPWRTAVEKNTGYTFGNGEWTALAWTFPPGTDHTLALLENYLGERGMITGSNALRHVPDDACEILAGFLRHEAPRKQPFADELFRIGIGRGVHFGLCSNVTERFASVFLDALGWTDVFEAVVCADDPELGGEWKPSPRPWKLLADRLPGEGESLVLLLDDKAVNIEIAAQVASRAIGILVAPEDDSQNGSLLAGAAGFQLLAGLLADL
jgi:phosphoglycolate phosphatase-like HAD superfamily hydrolase